MASLPPAIEIRQYVSTACDSCKRRRRKCDGSVVCSGCRSRGLACAYTENKPRGPQPKSLDILVARRPGRPGLSPGPEPPRLAAAAIRSALHFYNLFGRKLDVGLFDTAMAQAVTGASSYATDEVDLFHHPRSSSHSSVIACAFAIASLRCVQEGDESGTWQNFTAATMYVDQALDSGERPNQHLISALLLIDTASRGTTRRNDAFGSLAHRLCELLPSVCPEVFYSAACFYKQHLFLSAGVVWPPSSCPIGMSPAARLVDIIAFVTVFFMGAFDIAAGYEVAFFALLDEAAGLQEILAIMCAIFPVAPIAMATKAVLAYRFGSCARALEYSRAAFATLTLSTHASSILCVGTVVKLLLVLPSLLETCDLSASHSAHALAAAGLSVMSDEVFAVDAIATLLGATKVDLISFVHSELPLPCALEHLRAITRESVTNKSMVERVARHCLLPRQVDDFGGLDQKRDAIISSLLVIRSACE